MREVTFFYGSEDAREFFFYQAKIQAHLFTGYGYISGDFAFELRRNARIERHAGEACAFMIRAEPVIDEIDRVIHLIPERDIVVETVPNVVGAYINQRLKHLIAGEELFAGDGDEVTIWFV